MSDQPVTNGPLTIALPKGKLLSPCFDLLAACDLHFDADERRGRKLVIREKSGQVQALYVKGTDVPVYVEQGIADLGIAGSDSILESEADLLEPLQLGFGQCRLAVAGFPGAEEKTWQQRSILRVGSKYPRIAKWFFDQRGLQTEIIALQGSVELAVLTGMADLIVDIVETGTTLRENGLVVFEDVLPCSATLIVNRASQNLRIEEIDQLVQKIKTRVEEQQ